MSAGEDEAQDKKNPFGKVQTDEHAAIDARRRVQGRSAIQPARSAEDSTSNETAQFPVYNTFGVSLSGGGIRSAGRRQRSARSLSIRLRDRGDDLVHRHAVSRRGWTVIGAHNGESDRLAAGGNQVTAQRARFPNLKLSTTAISLRLPQGTLDRIKVAANKRDMPYQSLIKYWLDEKLKTE